VLVNHQVNGQGTQPRPGRQRGRGDAGRARRSVLLPAARAFHVVQVVLNTFGLWGRDFFLLIGPGQAQVPAIPQVHPARARALWIMVLGPARDFPGHRRAGATGLLAALLKHGRSPFVDTAAPGLTHGTREAIEDPGTAARTNHLDRNPDLSHQIAQDVPGLYNRRACG
jgi:hypothetical protein